MARIDVSNDGLVTTPFPTGKGVEVTGDTASYRVLTGDVTPLGIWRHELPPGGRITVDRPGADHVFYVEAGSIGVGADQAASGGAICVAHGGKAILESGVQGATLTHYLGDPQARRDKTGGCVHLLSDKGLLAAEDAENEMFQTLYADGRCPTCDVWLHKTRMAPEGRIPPHCHTEDEIITVVEGELMLGTRALGPGGAVAVPQQAFYSFTAGPNGLVFLNFRQREAFTQLKGSPPGQLFNERDYMYSLA